MKVTKMKAGVKIEVPLDDVWDSIVKVIRLARMSCGKDTTPELDRVRKAFLSERLQDLEEYDFHKLEK